MPTIQFVLELKKDSPSLLVQLLTAAIGIAV